MWQTCCCLLSLDWMLIVECSQPCGERSDGLSDHREKPRIAFTAFFLQIESATVCTVQKANKTGLEGGLPSSTHSSVHLQCAAGRRVLAPRLAGDVCRQQPPGAPGAEPPAYLRLQPPGGSWGSAPFCWPSAHCTQPSYTWLLIKLTPKGVVFSFLQPSPKP